MIRDVKYAKYHMDNELTGKIIKIDEGFSAITGYEWEDVQKNSMTIFDLVPEEDREEYTKMLYSFQEVGEAYINHKILCKDGRGIAVNCYGEVYVDSETNHKCTKILIIDVTEHEDVVSKLNEKEEQLALQIEKIKFLTENINEIFVDYDIKRDYLEISHFVKGEYEILFSKENYLAQKSETLHHEALNLFKRVVQEDVLMYEKSMVDFRSKLFTGTYRWYRLSYARYINPKTGKEHIIGRIIDINEEKLASMHSEKDVEYDKLTGLYNSIAMEAKVDDIFAVATDKKCTMLVVDVDLMSHINDTYGYEMGDRLLESISKVLCDMFRQDFDIVGRVYGDVFAVFIRNTMEMIYIEERCREICRKISEEISEDVFFDGYRATVSIGIAMGGKKIDSYKRIYKMADKAMQSQKENGRNGFSF
ncbi:MAG: sensor domain-containing diguanylate cyclase [Lachnospiraceae bacterium]|nr:sensor domain-containing diguanylate cyclase [Lachnospiraceae bacterium]